MFRERQLFAVPTDSLRIHDLIGLSVLEHPILMDAGAVSERILAHYGFIALHHETAHAGHKAGRLDDFVSVHLSRETAEVIAPRVECHDDLFKCGVTSTFTDSVHRAFDLTRSGFDRRQRVCYREPEVIVAMYADDCFARLECRNVTVEARYERPELARDC